MGHPFKVGKKMLHYLQTLLLPVQISKQVPVVMRVQGQAMRVVLVQFDTPWHKPHIAQVFSKVQIWYKPLPTLQAERIGL